MSALGQSQTFNNLQNSAAKPLWKIGVKPLERVKGIEPSYAAWEAAVLPLNYTRALLSL